MATALRRGTTKFQNLLAEWREKVSPLPQSQGSFAVDDVLPERKLLETESLTKNLAERFRRKILVLPQSDKQVINSAASGGRLHPLIAAVHAAFSRHYSLTLSPDAIWLVIAQGFSHHLTENAEALRGRLVRHQGRRALIQSMENLSLATFEGAIACFSSQIRDASDPVLHETLVCDFTTTTPLTRTASEVVLMDCYSSYFAYRADCICGIPRITLTGTAEDWRRIRARVEALETYDLGWWVGRLRPILDEFVKTAEGAPDREFWQAIYKPKHVYATTIITGWIADLFPYLNDAPKRVRNGVLACERERWALPVEKGIPARRPEGVSQSSLPSGLSSVPVHLSFPDGSASTVDLVAGCLAVEQSRQDLSISPVIGWCVADEPQEKVLVFP